MKLTQRIVFLVVGLAILGGTYAFLARRSAHADTHATAAATSGAAPAGSGSGGPADRVVPVSTATVAKHDVPIMREGLGTVTSLATVTMKTLVDGRLEKVLFQEGQSVKKGDLLAVVDPRPFRIQLDTAQAALARDDANLKNNQLNLTRYEDLRKQNLIPQQQVDDQRAAVAQLEASTRADHAQIDSAKLMLDYANIRAPVDGVTGVRLVDQGNIVHPSDANGIVIVTQLDPIAVVFTLPQDDLDQVQAALKQGKPAVEAYARDGVQKLGQGELQLIDNQVNAQTATIRLKATFQNPDHALWPNGFVKARLHVKTVKDALVVPASVVQRGPNGTFAYVMSPEKTVQPKPVEVVSVQGDTAIIGKGLTEGEVVVTDGQNQLKPGSKVSPRAPAAPKASR
ncbi:putative Co/Zn/Cd efflux system membrane fusion protein [Labilithrix luteola]|uniref:Putative Co/Zn/Cd efflux system membrane fusion protein n=1 Tax=Labilithrix luteola TaxID=1391654 RepID=A0A0K1QCT8_9BACT|nr:efflux RND transporter periplasmic adaptor subunit [Labilithrix luteola]AKV03601.1 putative Co/Zn/Cd efflux system membrane fusion protein [Labilithrix luteola]